MTASAPSGPFGRDTPIGFIGLGVMGGGMATCLLRRGHRLHVHARRAEVAQRFAQMGAQAAATPAALGRAAPLVFLCLPDGPALEQVLFEPDGLAAGLAAGSVVVDTSTIAASEARAIGARLAAQGASYLDAPVSGGQQGADAGTLACMVGGPEAAVAACREVMAAFCKSVTHVGATGAGQAVKACNQVAVAGALLGVADAIALAKTEGVDLAVMREVLLAGTARSFSLEKHAPRIIDGDFVPGFRAALMRKDLGLALQAAQDAGAQLQAAALAAQLLDDACAAGRAGWDWTALALEVQKRSGMDVPASPGAGG